MKISKVDVNGHQLLKELDNYEVMFWLNTDLFLKHINNQPPYDDNPHNTVAGQIPRTQNTWDVSDNLQLHTDNYFVHIVWSEHTEIYTAGDVNPSKQLGLLNTQTILKCDVHVDGRKMIRGVDFMMLSSAPGATIKFLDPSFPDGNTSMNIEVEYRQRL